MAHPMAGQAKSSEKARLKRLQAHAGKSWGSSDMYKKTSYPKKNAGSSTPMTISGGSSKSRPDRMAGGGGVRHRKPHSTTNIIISHAGGRGGSGGGGGGGPQPPGATPVPVPRPVPVPVGAGGPGPVGPPPAGPGPIPPPVGAGIGPRPPIMPPPGMVPPGVRPPGMKKGGAVKKRASGGAYPGYPHSPTSNVDDAVSAHKDGGSPGGYRRSGNLKAAGEEKTYAKGGAVKKRQMGGAGLGSPGGLPQSQQGATSVLGTGPQRQPLPGQSFTQNISGVQGIPPQAGVPVPGRLGSNWLTRPPPGTTTTYAKKGGGVKYAKGGETHDDEQEDRKLFGKMLKERGVKKRAAGGGTGFTPKNQDSKDPGLVGGMFHHEGKGFAKGGKVGKLNGGGHAGPIRLGLSKGKTPTEKTPTGEA